MTEPRINIDDSLAYRIHRSARLLRAHLLRSIRDLGYDATPEQWFVLNKLDERDGQSQTELCDAIFSDRPNLTRMIEVMEKKGWVARREDPEDARRKRVHLTKAGKTAAHRIAAMAKEQRELIFDGLSEDAITTTQQTLSALESNVHSLLK